MEQGNNGSASQPRDDGPGRPNLELEELVRHLMQVVETQRTHLAQLLEENAQLREVQTPATVFGGPGAGQLDIYYWLRGCTPPSGTLGSPLDGLAQLPILRPCAPALGGELHLTPIESHACGAGSSSAADAQRPPRGGIAPPFTGGVVARPIMQIPPRTTALGIPSVAGVVAEPIVPQHTAPEDSEPARRCIECGTSHTPKWRKGNRFCNACGIRTSKQPVPSHDIGHQTGAPASDSHPAPASV